MNAPVRPTPDRLAEIARQLSGRHVVVVGDLVADQFLYGEIARVSREAPVFILRHERTDTVPGGAANCAINLAALGARASLIGVVGADEVGRSLLSQLQLARVDNRGVVVSPGTNTTTKVRVLAGQAHSTRQQVIRVDYEQKLTPDRQRQESLMHNLRSAFAAAADAVIISHYNYGVSDEEITALLRELCGARPVPVIVDSRFRLTQYPDFTSATPNQDEVEHAFGKQFNKTIELEQAAALLRAQLNCPALLVTRGSQGMLLQEANQIPYHIAAVGGRDPVDVTGAGDTVIAAYTLALAAGATFVEAAHLANHAGGLVVMKRGTASVSPEELLSSVGSDK
ncbi:MAG: PfkB family carbohydrate kinase [Pyrinomonadaceae bacterium]